MSDIKGYEPWSRLLTRLTRRRLLRGLSQGAGLMAVSGLYPVSTRAAQQQPCNDADLISALMRCGLNVTRAHGQAVLSLGSGDEAAFCQALRCFSDTMKKRTITAACAEFQGTKVRWGSEEALSQSAGEIVIATSSLASVWVVAGSEHGGCSVYASGGKTDSVSAEVYASGPRSQALACGGHASSATGGNGGHASANAHANALAYGANGKQGGRGGKATATSLGATGRALAQGGEGGAHLTGSGGPGGSADALARHGSALAIGGLGGQANLEGNGGNGGQARADSGNGSAKAQGGNGGHVAECCGDGGQGGRALAHSTGDVSTARGGAGGTGRGQGRRGGSGGDVRSDGNPTFVAPGTAGVGEEQADDGQRGKTV